MGASFSADTCKVYLKLASRRCEKLMQKQDRAIKLLSQACAKYLAEGQEDLARAKCQLFIAQTDMNAACAALLHNCEVLLAQFAAIENSTSLPCELGDVVATLDFCSTRMEVPELKKVMDQLQLKYASTDLRASLASFQPVTAVTSSLSHQPSFAAVTNNLQGIVPSYLPKKVWTPTGTPSRAERHLPLSDVAVNLGTQPHSRFEFHPRKRSSCCCRYFIWPFIISPCLFMLLVVSIFSLKARLWAEPPIQWDQAIERGLQDAQDCFEARLLPHLQQLQAMAGPPVHQIWQRVQPQLQQICQQVQPKVQQATQAFLPVFNEGWRHTREVVERAWVIMLPGLLEFKGAAQDLVKRSWAAFLPAMQQAWAAFIFRLQEQMEKVSPVLERFRQVVLNWFNEMLMPWLQRMGLAVSSYSKEMAEKVQERYQQAAQQ
eukprot:gb/GEZN01006221.1/.p1 GENE.gb/GEZN01006221.1/~~gb/GEZN01006221.1/.p1  ORF type:complete len:432 (-),score=58.69 gb/GEZN01006221.1/:329-1624(-)